MGKSGGEQCAFMCQGVNPATGPHDKADERDTQFCVPLAPTVRTHDQACSRQEGGSVGGADNNQDPRFTHFAGNKSCKTNNQKCYYKGNIVPIGSEMPSVVMYQWKEKMRRQNTKEIRGAVERPSLYRSASENVDAAKNMSILAALEPCGTFRTFRLKKAPLVTLAVIASAAMIVASLRYVQTASGWSDAIFQYSPVTPQSGNAVALQRALLTESTEMQSPATIVNDQADMEAPPPSVSEPDISVNWQLALAATSDQHVPEVIASSGSANAGAINEVGKSSAQMKFAKEGKGATGAVVIKKPNGSPRQKGKDKDVELIAALLSHVSQPDTTTKEPGQKKLMAVTSAQTSPVAEKEPGINRDVVVWSRGDSAESLVKRCQELGFIERELCRMRICSDLWGKTPACPTSEHGVSGQR